MPTRKKAVFLSAAAALLVVMTLSIIMSIHHYEKTVLITLEAAGDQAAGNETGLAEIRRQLDADQADESTGWIAWNGTVCVTRYRAWGGRATVYYVCPYLAVNSSDTVGDEPSEWTLSLRFAMCAVQGEELVAFNKVFSVKNITISCRSGKSAAILSAAYTDMDTTEINGDTLSYTFRDRDEVTVDTDIYAKLILALKDSVKVQLNEKDTANEKNALIVNWTFTLEEDGRLVNDFDGVQIEIAYEPQETDGKEAFE